MQHFRNKHFWLGCALLFISACGEITTPGEALVIQTASLEPAFNGEEYNLNIFSSGGVRPHVCELNGRLPTGLRLDSCSLRGIPTEEGSFNFSIIVSDSSLSKTFRDYTLSVQAPPPAQIILDVPNTQVSGEFTLPIRLEKANDVRGMRMALIWERDVFDFVALRQRRNDVIVLQELQDDALRVDVASINNGLEGDILLFDLVLEARRSDYIELEVRTEFSTAENGHDYRTERAGRTPESRNDDNTSEYNPDSNDNGLGNDR